MIFYFSGVGNSAWVARQLAERLDEQLAFITDIDTEQEDFHLAPGERVGFVFPTYAWGVPTFVEQFIGQVKLHGVEYLYMVTTCGDDTGKTGEIFRKCVEKRGWTCAAAWAVQMPESYICLPGFDVDSPQKEHRKYEQAKKRLADIVEHIQEKRQGVSDTLPGHFTWLKSQVVRPFFNRYLIDSKPFRTTDACTGCGRCAKVCPCHNIRLTPSNKSVDKEHPTWGTDCVLCLRCYHSCPEHALHWGRMTKNKGQYLCHIEQKHNSQ